MLFNALFGPEAPSDLEEQVSGGKDAADEEAKVSEEARAAAPLVPLLLRAGPGRKQPPH